MDVAREHELVRAAGAGDPAARERLYRDNAARLYNYVFWRVGSRVHAAEDVVQDVFLDAFSSIGSFRGESGFFAYLCGIAYRKIAMVHRKEGRRSAVETRLESADPAALRLAAYLDGNEPLPLDALEQEDVRRIVSASLASLPPRWQALLTGKYVDGRSAEDLARDGGESVAAVNSALQRARATFGESLRLALGTEF